MVSHLLPLHAEGISVHKRGKHLMGPVDLTLESPRITVVLGPNGAGKTTLLKALHGLERLSQGKVRWNLPGPDAAKRQAFVFQTPIMLRRSVFENLAYPLSLEGRGKSEITSIVQDWAARIGLSDTMNRSATQLSGGEKQKLALARALIPEPDVLFLDEPCTNLDGRATKEIETMLIEAHARGTSLFMATHDLGQARRLGQHLIYMIGGQIHEAGPATICFSTPQTASLRAFLKGDIVG